MKLISRAQQITLSLCLSSGILFFASNVKAALLQPEPLAFQDEMTQLQVSELPRFVWLARQNLKSGKFEQAKLICEQILSAKEYNVEALALLAAAFKGLGDEQAYLRVSSQVRQLAAESSAMPLALATVYQVKNDLAAAERVYLEGIETVSNKADLRMELAHLYLEQQRLQEAEAQYQNVLEQKGLSTQHTLNANFALCRLGLQEKAYDDVIKRAKSLTELYPPIPQGYQFLGSAHLGKGETKQAITTYDSLIKANPQSSLPYQELAVIALDRTKDIKKALSYAAEGAKRFPDDAKTQDVLGWVYYQQGNPIEAIRQFQAATRLAPDNAQFFYHLGLAQQKLGNKNQAKMAYQRSLGLIDQTRSKAFADELNKRIKTTEE